MKSIKHIMTLYFSVIVLAAAISLSGLAYYKAADSLEKAAAESLTNVATEASNVIEAKLDGRFALLEAVAARNIIRGVWGSGASTWEQKFEILTSEKGRDSFLFLSIADKNGVATSTNGKTVNISDRDYFQKALSGQRAISEPILNKETNSLTLSFAVPIKDASGTTVSGVLIGVADAVKFNAIIKDITYGKTGNAFMLSTNGTTIAHPDEKLVLAQDNDFENIKSDASLASILALEKRMVSGEKGAGMYEYKGTKKMLGFAPVKSTGWSLAVAAPATEVLAGAKSLAIAMALITAIILILAAIAIYFLSNRIALPISLASAHLATIADNDYTMPIPPEYLKRHDEIGLLAKSIDTLQAKVKAALSAVKASAQAVQQQSETLGATSEEIASTSGQVAQTVQEVAKGAAHQASDMDQLTGLIQNVADNMTSIYSQLEQVKDNTEHTSTKAQEGKTEIDLLVKSIASIKTDFTAVAEKIGELANSVGQIGNITATINTIAGQTNLLALNAAIEAARAGEAGRGFAVVAEEVRKLAEQSDASANDIQRLVSSITTETGEVNNTAQQVSTQMQQQVETVTHTVSTFEAIINSISQVLPSIAATYTIVNDTATAKDTLISTATNLSAVISQTSAATEEIAASSEEVSASTEEIASSAQTLQHAAIGMLEKVNQFNLG